MKLRAAFLLATLVAASVLVPTRSEAFCGFYVGGTDAKLFNDATVVVLMREGTRTVLSMQNTYKGPPEKFAMVVPVPVVLHEENVKTLKRELFDHVDQLASPRLVEYWEQDPCYEPPPVDMAAVPMPSPPSAPAVGAAVPSAFGVTIEAQFTVGEYKIVILGAKDSTGLEKWLTQEKYTIPAGAAAYFRPYVAAGSKFFVAKVDPQKVQRVEGLLELSPLRFHYDSDEFRLPVKLGLINSGGTQDLIVHILGRGTRYEVANYPNVTIPTNLDVSEQARESFGTFYTSLFDRTLEKNPKAAVTEYAWEPTSCDPCPGPALDLGDLATLGGDALPSSQPVAPQPVRPPVAPSSTKPSGSTKATTPVSCDPPYWFDAQQVKHYRPECVFGNGPPAAPAAPPSPNSPPPSPPMPRFNPRSGGQMVLTRLHLRYDKEALGEDLVFKAAPPIVGGREIRGGNGIDGPLEHGATTSGYNNFQARYAIRHPWTGPIACKSPRRNVWGGNPGNHSAAPAPVAARKLGLVAHAKADLASLVKQDVPELGVTSSSPTPAPASASSVSPPPSSFPSPAPPSEKKGCAGCASVSDPGTTRAALGLALAGVFVAALRRRRR